jgi:lipocalin
MVNFSLLGIVAIANALPLPGAGNLRGRELAWGCPKWAPSFICQQVSSTCPTVTPVNNFDVDKYTEKTWYVQKQQVNGYQKAEDLYCVTATYTKADNGLIKVENRANKGGVNKGISGEDGTKGSSWFSSFTSLCAKQITAGTGKLAVQPCFLFNLGLDSTAGPYWVLAIDKENYEWAVISGGQPTEVISNDSGSVQCTTKKTGTNGSGLWLFTRSAIPAKGVVAAMEKKLTDMGVSTKRLLPVTQAGCKYENMPIKPASAVAPSRASGAPEPAYTSPSAPVV